jgi:hypothetical protein
MHSQAKHDNEGADPSSKPNYSLTKSKNPSIDKAKYQRTGQADAKRPSAKASQGQK